LLTSAFIVTSQGLSGSSVTSIRRAAENGRSSATETDAVRAMSDQTWNFDSASVSSPA